MRSGRIPTSSVASDCMRYMMPNFPCGFEIPDAWLNEAGINGFSRTTSAYRSTSAASLVLLREVEPPHRVVEHPKDWLGFDRSRLISVLRGIVSSAEFAPVPLLTLLSSDFPRPPYRYRVRDGFHRFYASIAAGFECLPAAIDS